MFFIPYGHLIIRTKLKRNDVIQRLSGQVESHRATSAVFKDNAKYFIGSVGNEQFKINCFSRPANFFSPVIIGEVQEKTNYSVINLTLRLGFTGLLLGVLSLPLFVFPVFILFTSAFSEFLKYFQNQSDNFILQIAFLKIILLIWGLTIISLLGLYLFFLIPFNLEARKIVEYLNELWGVENQTGEHQQTRASFTPINRALLFLATFAVAVLLRILLIDNLAYMTGLLLQLLFLCLPTVIPKLIEYNNLENPISITGVGWLMYMAVFLLGTFTKKDLIFALCYLIFLVLVTINILAVPINYNFDYNCGSM